MFTLHSCRVRRLGATITSGCPLRAAWRTSTAGWNGWKSCWVGRDHRRSMHFMMIAWWMFALVAGASPASQPLDDYGRMAGEHVARLKAALADIDSGLANDPPTEKRDQLLISRLRLTFELSTILGEPLGRIDRLATEMMQQHPGRAVAVAAEYWRLRVQLAGCMPGPASQPSAALRVERAERFLAQFAGA